jgi:hypothetical protein
MAVIFVTHSVAEAVFLSQRVLVMAARPGRIVHELQVPGPAPGERPASFRHDPAFVAACRELSQALEDAMGDHGHATGEPVADGAAASGVSTRRESAGSTPPGVGP